METVSASQSQSYIDQYYVDIASLSEMAQCSADRILELVEARCIPPHAYEVRTQKTFISSFGEYNLSDAPVFYYHPKHVEWIKQAEKLAKDHPLKEVAKQVEAKFTEDVLNSLGDRSMPWPAGISHVWNYLMDGTWSLCLKEFSVPDLVTKELARSDIAALTNGFTKHQLELAEQQTLNEAIDAFNQVALPFSPHEVGESSRCLEVGKAIALIEKKQTQMSQQSH